MTSILIVEDDPLILTFIERGLRSSGFATTTVTDAALAQQLAMSGEFDLMVLDLVLGDGDGSEVLRWLRTNRRSLPVVVITGHPLERDVVDVLDAGADDYLAKPFRFEELLARIRVRLRREDAATDSVLTVGDLTLHLLTRRVSAGGRPIELTSREFTLLETLMRHPDQVLTRAQLLSHVWGYTFDPGSNVVNVYVAALRTKVGQHRIETVRGVGYRLREIDARSDDAVLM